jgi:hypothetical protein
MEILLKVRLPEGNVCDGASDSKFGGHRRVVEGSFRATCIILNCLWHTYYIIHVCQRTLVGISSLNLKQIHLIHREIEAVAPFISQ